MSMLNDFVVGTENVGSNLGLPRIQEIRSAGACTTSVYHGPPRRLISNIMFGPQTNPLAQVLDAILSRSEVGTQFCSSDVAGSTAPSIRFHEPHSAPDHQLSSNSERLVSGGLANDTFCIPRQGMTIIDQPGVGLRPFMNLDNLWYMW